MVHIRRARPEDAQAIAEVHVQSWRETYPGIVPSEVLDKLSIEDRRKSWAEHLGEGPPYHRFTFVAEDSNGQIVGFAAGGALRKDFTAGEGVPESVPDHFDGELQAIYLLRDYQRQGIGRDLFRAVAGELKNRGFHSMLVWVLKENLTKAFYQAMGGAPVAEKKIKIGAWLVETAYGWESL